MTKKQFYDWQTAGAGGDVFLLAGTLERVETPWCAIGGLAVNHWAKESLITADVELVVATNSIDKAFRRWRTSVSKLSTLNGRST